MRAFFSTLEPILEYGEVAWRPYKTKDIVALEKVQRRFTKMIPEVRNLDYESRLKSLGLFSLEHIYRRRRGDLIEAFKMSKSGDNLFTKHLQRAWT